MEKRVGICPQPTMSSTSSNPYFFFFILATAAMSSDLHLLSFSVTCLFKKREKEKKKKAKKSTHSPLDGACESSPSAL
jgi:uncharacterized metal-binding protein